MGTAVLWNSEPGDLSLSAAELFWVLLYCRLQCSTNFKFFWWWAAFTLLLEYGLQCWRVLLSVPVSPQLSAVATCLCYRGSLSLCSCSSSFLVWAASVHRGLENESFSISLLLLTLATKLCLAYVLSLGQEIPVLPPAVADCCLLWSLSHNGSFSVSWEWQIYCSSPVALHFCSVGEKGLWSR